MAENYSLSDLSEKTGVDARMIRYYIAEGLLRGPESLGRNAHYTDHHRKRLETIKLLKDTYGLPLGEIRRYIIMAGDEDIQVVPIADFARKSTPDSSARAAHRSTDLAPSLRGSPSAIDMHLIKLRTLLGGRRVSRSAKASGVFEIPIIPDISLRVAGAYGQHEIASFEQLADCLREILLGGTDSEGTSD